MDIFEFSERSMKMSPLVWAKHANPLSVYSRLVSGTLVFLALWSVFWIHWYAILAIVTAIAWIVLNPRLFKPPENTTSWAARGVLGERVFLNRKKVAIPKEHERFAWISTTTSMLFLFVVVAAFISRDFWLAFWAWHASTVAKVWFVDRMAWLWSDMKDTYPLYQAWSECQWEFAMQSDKDRD